MYMGGLSDLGLLHAALTEEGGQAGERGYTSR